MIATCSVWRRSSRIARDTLRNLAPAHRDNPNVVLLTPGAVQRNLFRTCLPGPLSWPSPRRRGATSPCANSRVFIKTLEGLQPVDVILRRVDDSFCDPLELRGDSFLGVPGLVEAARAGMSPSPIRSGIGPGRNAGFARLPAASLPALAWRRTETSLRCHLVVRPQARGRNMLPTIWTNMVIKRAFRLTSREPIFRTEV